MRIGVNTYSMALIGMLVFFVSTPLWAQRTLDNIDYRSTSGGSVELILDFSELAPDPQIFTTDNPARIALDLPNTLNALDERLYRVDIGATDSVAAVEAAGRTRVVIDLYRSAAFDTRIEGDRIILDISSGTQAVGANLRQDELFSVDERAVRSDTNSIQNVDFRRGPDGEGRVIVNFSDPSASIDLNRVGDDLFVSMYGVRIPPDLEQRLDVTDFATPVEFVRIYRDGQRVRMEIDARPPFEQLAYQAGTQYVVEVKEFQPEEPTPEELLLEEPEYTGSRVTFNFQNIPVRAVLQLIADVSGLNIVVSDTVQGDITLRLQNVPWDQALDIVLQARSLDQRRVGNVIWVAPAAEIAAREQQQLQALQDRRSLEPLTSAYIQVNYAKAVDLRELLEENVGGEDEGGLLSGRGTVSVDERTNVLLVTDTTDRIAVVREVVAQLDRPVRQVQIESRIVIATDSFGEELGARFGITGAHEDDDENLFSTAGSLNATDRMSNLGLINRQINPNNSNFPVIGPDTPPAGISVPPLGERLNVNLPAAAAAGSFALSILTSDYLLDLELSALEEEGRGEVVSSPRLITANQSEAFIQQGVEIPFQQATSSGATAIQFKEAVLELRVQPLITPDDRVILDLAVKQDTVGELVPVEGGGQVPSIDTRELGTQVLVDSGQTVVLGGIFEQTLRFESDKVPFLGDIPALGALFRNRIKQNDKAELLIFVTPTILDDTVVVN